MIVYIPQDVYDRLYTRLKDMPEKIPGVLKDSVNKTAEAGKKRMLKEMQEKYVVKAKGFNKAVGIEKATSKYLQATIYSEGGHIPLYEFRYRSNNGTKGAKAKVLTSSRLKDLSLKGGDINGKDLKAFIQQTKNGHWGIFRRMTEGERGQKKVARNGIKQLYSLSAPQMAESKKVYPVMEDFIMNELCYRMEKHIASVMEGL